MKVNTQLRDVDVSDNIVSQDFKIQASAHMFSLLADKLYSRKEEAVIREYCCNAMDGHAMIDQTKPWWISLPNQIEPMLTIRDFGPGMSHSDVMNRFTSFGDSSKNDDANQIGGFGLGCKSGFAYADAFTLASIQAGVRRSYAAFRAATGVPQITFAGEEPTDEEDGFEIRIPVREADYAKFRETAQRVLQHFPEGSFEAHGVEVKPVAYVAKSDNYWTRVTEPPKHQVLMGPVAYEVDWDAVLGDEAEAPPKTVVPVFPVGELDLMPSREGLSYDRSTKVKLADFYTTFCIQFAHDFNDRVQKLDRWEQMKAVNEARKNNTWRWVAKIYPSGLPGVVEHYTIKGKPEVVNAEAKEVSKGRRWNRTYSTSVSASSSRVEEPTGIKLKYPELSRRQVVLVFDDMVDAKPHQRRALARFKELAREEGETLTIYLFDQQMVRINPVPEIIGPRHPSDPALKVKPEYAKGITGGYTCREDLVALLDGYPDAEERVYNLSDLDLPTVEKVKAQKTTTVRVLEVMGGKAEVPWDAKSYWTDRGNTATSGIYVPLSGYDSDLPGVPVKALLNCEFVKDTLVWGLSKKAQEQLRKDGNLDQFERLDVYVARLAAEALATPGVMEELYRREHRTALADVKYVSEVVEMLSYRSDKGAALFPKLAEALVPFVCAASDDIGDLAKKVRNYYSVKGLKLPAAKASARTKVIKVINSTLEMSPLLRMAVARRRSSSSNMLSVTRADDERDLVALAKVRQKKEQTVDE